MLSPKLPAQLENSASSSITTFIVSSVKVESVCLPPLKPSNVRKEGGQRMVSGLSSVSVEGHIFTLTKNSPVSSVNETKDFLAAIFSFRCMLLCHLKGNMFYKFVNDGLLESTKKYPSKLDIWCEILILYVRPLWMSG